MDPTTIDALVGLGLRLGASLGQVLVAAIQTGDVATVEALAQHLPPAEGLQALDAALRVRQRREAAAVLRRDDP